MNIANLQNQIEGLQNQIENQITNFLGATKINLKLIAACPREAETRYVSKLNNPNVDIVTGPNGNDLNIREKYNRVIGPAYINACSTQNGTHLPFGKYSKGFVNGAVASHNTNWKKKETKIKTHAYKTPKSLENCRKLAKNRNLLCLTLRLLD